MLLAVGYPTSPLRQRGDSNGDGAPDLWTTTSNATAGLEFIPGRRSGPHGPPVVVGAGGWQAIKAIS
ncbi:hypothetical protein ACWD0Z_24570 [Streptomyces sp. NPDC003007]